MLQPAEPPVLQPVVVSVGVPAGQSAREQQEKTNIWKWISVKEVVFVFMACSIGAALFRSKDNLQFENTWTQKIDTKLYKNTQFPFGDEKLPPPLVTDMDNDGVADVLSLTYDHHMKLLTFTDIKNPLKPLSTKHRITEKASVDIWQLTGGSKPITMATGFLRQYQSMIQVRQQVVVVLTSDWTVLCLDHELNLLWKAQPVLEDGKEFVIREAAILVSPVSIQRGDVGSVIVGGRTFNRQKPEDSFKRMRRGQTPEDEDELLDTLGHYTTFALEGKSGEERWKHTPEDFKLDAAYPPDISPFHHLKLVLHKRVNHEGEVSWQQYSSAIRSVLPHTWQRSGDTYFELAHFKKDRKRSEEHDVTEHMSRVGDFAVGHIAGLAFGGLQPHSPSEHVQDPNVLIIHSVKGVDVLHLYQGRPLCSLRLSPYHTSHADINGDGTIDHVYSVVNPGEAGFSEEDQNDPDCFGQAIPMALGSKPLFKHSICKATHWTETFVASEKWLPALNKVGRKLVNHAITEPLSPVLIESSYHSTPLKLHLSRSGRGQSDHSRSYDSVFVLSSGRITSIGPQGEFNWQVDTKADWDTASEVIYDPQHPDWQEKPDHIMFVHGGFTPSALPYSLQAYGKKDHILVSGWNRIVLVSGEDGSVVAGPKPHCQPVTTPTIADFSGDGWNDIIVTCAEHHLGYTLNRQSGYWHSTVLSLFVGVVVVVIAIYTRQRTVGLLPAVKTAQD